MAVEKLKYTNAAAIAITLASLASDADRLAGRESAAIDNSSNLFLDALVSGFVKLGAGAEEGRIDIWAYASHDHTPTYQAPFDGTDSDETLGSSGQRGAQLVRLASIAVTDPSQLTYYLRPTSIAAAFGGIVPLFWGLFVAHDTGVALDATGGNHEFKYTGVHRETV